MEYKRIKKDVKYQEDDETESDIFCKICRKQFEKESSVKDHTDRVHKRIKNYQCPHCATLFFKQNDLNRHIKRKHTICTTAISNQHRILSATQTSFLS